LNLVRTGGSPRYPLMVAGVQSASPEQDLLVLKGLGPNGDVFTQKEPNKGDLLGGKEEYSGDFVYQTP